MSFFGRNLNKVKCSDRFSSSSCGADADCEYVNGLCKNKSGGPALPSFRRASGPSKTRKVSSVRKGCKQYKQKSMCGPPWNPNCDWYRGSCVGKAKARKSRSQNSSKTAKGLIKAGWAINPKTRRVIKVGSPGWKKLTKAQQTKARKAATGYNTWKKNLIAQKKAKAKRGPSMYARCAPGTMRDRKSGLCIKTNCTRAEARKVMAKRRRSKSKRRSSKRKSCRKGYRRNSVTKRCRKIKRRSSKRRKTRSKRRRSRR